MNSAHRPVVVTAIVLAAITAPVPRASTGQSPAEPLVVTLATATPGGGFPLYGEALADVVGQIDPSIQIRTRNTAGSTENIPLLEHNDVDLALVQGEAVHEAFAGVGRPPVALPILSAMYSTPGFFAVRADARYRSIGDLRGSRIALGARGSGLVILARYVLDGLGLDADRDFTPTLLERAGDGPQMVRDGRVDALWGGGAGWPGFADLLAGPGGARLIAPSAQEIAKIVAAHPFLKPLVLPAGAYPQQTAPITSVGSWSLILTRAALPDEVAYRLAKALHLGESALAARLPQARETTAKNSVAAAMGVGALHPGVSRYFREIGLLR